MPNLSYAVAGESCLSNSHLPITSMTFSLTFVPFQAQSVDWNKITQATRNQVARASFIESMRATWENRRNQTVQFKCVPYFNIIGR